MNFQWLLSASSSNFLSETATTVCATELVSQTLWDLGSALLYTSRHRERKKGKLGKKLNIEMWFQILARVASFCCQQFEYFSLKKF